MCVLRIYSFYNLAGLKIKHYTCIIMIHNIEQILQFPLEMFLFLSESRRRPQERVRMGPKKVDEPERKPLIGRVGTNLKVGIVGVPNVGKSTFFNVLTKSQAAAENFPFCTIDPNENKYLPIL